MDRAHAQKIIESHLGLDDSEINLALETLGFQALSTEALDLIAGSQVTRVQALHQTRSNVCHGTDSQDHHRHSTRTEGR